MFAYCGNNPTNRLDPSGNEYTIVGAGIQFEVNIGNATGGIEIIVYWDVDECEGKGFQVAVYCYGGISLDADDPFLASIMAAFMDNVDMFVDASDVEIMAAAMMLSNNLSASISGVVIMGNENFTSTESYTEDFTSVGAGCGIVKGGFAYSDSCVALSLGRKYDTTFSLIPSLSVSDTYYIQMCEFNVLDYYKGICIL